MLVTRTGAIVPATQCHLPPHVVGDARDSKPVDDLHTALAASPAASLWHVASSDYGGAGATATTAGGARRAAEWRQLLTALGMTESFAGLPVRGAEPFVAPPAFVPLAVDRAAATSASASDFTHSFMQAHLSPRV